MSEEAKYFTCVVIGAGVAGCAVALNLIKLGTTVLAIDNAKASTFPLGHSLTPQAINHLSSLDLLKGE
jgi:2-polyprenyl-6-methoxyphenol hydroxylase-like FAD-dependent oxidoreductase